MLVGPCCLEIYSHCRQLTLSNCLCECVLVIYVVGSVHLIICLYELFNVFKIINYKEQCAHVAELQTDLHSLLFSFDLKFTCEAESLSRLSAYMQKELSPPT